jgi:hypothetical protein
MNNGFEIGGGGNLGYGTRGFGTGELKNYGYNGPPPQLQKGLSLNPSTEINQGPVRAMNLGYNDSQSMGGVSHYSGMKGGNTGFGKYDAFD